MSTPTPLPHDAHGVEPRPTRASVRRRRAGRGVILFAAGGLLLGTVAVSTTGTATPVAGPESLTSPDASAQSWTYRNRYGAGGTGTEGDGGGDATPGATVDSQPATTAQSRAVTLVDTLLSDGEAAGTGIVLTSDGEVLTNYHVVEGSSSIRVRIAGSTRAYTATVVGADPSADVALLQLKGASGLVTAKIDDDTVRLGEAVTAVGNAGGTGQLSAAAGTVTALSTSITTQSEDSVAGERLSGVLETSADVVPGDSGGPLLDDEGEVVGIDTAASSGSEIDGYAIPIADALAVVTQIADGHETSTVRIGAAAFLGVELGSGVDTAGAAVLGVLDGGAADDAGLTSGDTITKLGSAPVSDHDDLTRALARLQPGTKVELTWVDADGDTRSHLVTLGSSPVN